jgi:hypothetical protein
MKRVGFISVTLIVLLSLLILSSSNTAFAQSISKQTASAAVPSQCITPGATNTLHGSLQGANYTIAVPANWNGTLLLFSHGYTFATSPLANPAPDASDAATAAVLLSQGYALTGSSYSQNGWALQQAFNDQITLLNFFDQTCGKPARTIPWGESLGGIITAGLVQLNPNRFAAALPMCGVLAGGIGTWNTALDGAFAFNILLAGSKLPIVNIGSANALTDFQQAEAIITQAQQTPQGRARIALAAALGDLPGWFTPGSPEPASNDFAAQEQNQFLWDSQIDFAFSFLARAELEGRAGGNPSWNVGVNYNLELLNSVDLQEVVGLYKQAGLNLGQDLHTLNAAPRIAADPHAVSYLNNFITFNGQLNIPELTVHTVGDGLVVNQEEQAYASAVDARGNGNLLRQVFVNRAGHCAFTPAETLAAVQTLVQRVNTGRWGDSTNPTIMNQEATSFGPALNVAPAAFIPFRPAPFLRPFNAG